VRSDSTVLDLRKLIGNSTRQFSPDYFLTVHGQSDPKSNSETVFGDNASSLQVAEFSMLPTRLGGREIIIFVKDSSGPRKTWALKVEPSKTAAEVIGMLGDAYQPVDEWRLMLDDLPFKPAHALSKSKSDLKTVRNNIPVPECVLPADHYTSRA